MRILLILSFILLICSTNSSIRKLTNPILPINLLPTRVILNKHTFVTYMNLTELNEIKTNLETQLNFVISKKNLGSHTFNLIKQAKTLLSMVNNSLQTIYPHKRIKRGLINLGGKISKWLFGTLDADDGKRIDLILKHLDKNDHLLQEKINEQISLTKEIMNKTNKSIFQIKSNIKIIESVINKFSEELNEVNTLELIINSLLILQIQLNEISNALTFANLNKVHPSFLSLENLNIIFNKIKTLYSSKQIVQFKNYLSYYSLLGIQAISKENRLIFLIHFPILIPFEFTTYFIYPIPIFNKIISPPKPYLILNERNELYQYQLEPCEEIEKTFYCHNYLQTEEDCIVNIVTQNKASNCTAVPVNLDEPIANQVTPQNILFTTPKNIIITESCSVEKHHELTPGSYLISIPTNCYFRINDEIFLSGNEDLPPAKVIQLPQLNLSEIPERPSKIKLTKMDLEEIKHLTTKINSQHEIFLPKDKPVEDHSTPIWIIILICLFISILVFMGVTCYYRMCYPYPYPLCKEKNKKEKSKMENMEMKPCQPNQP